MLSRRVSAYYGLIRDSGLLPPIYALDGESPWPYYLPPEGQRFPHFTLPVCACVPPSVPRWTMRLLLTVTSSHLLAFANFVVARHPLLHEIRFIVACNEAAKFTLCYGPSGLLALPRPGLLLSSFHLRGSLFGNVEYNYMGRQSIPMTGLSPARHAALWAAHEISRTNTKQN